MSRRGESGVSGVVGDERSDTHVGEGGKAELAGEERGCEGEG